MCYNIFYIQEVQWFTGVLRDEMNKKIKKTAYKMVF